MLKSLQLRLDGRGRRNVEGQEQASGVGKCDRRTVADWPRSQAE